MENPSQLSDSWVAIDTRPPSSMTNSGLESLLIDAQSESKNPSSGRATNPSQTVSHKSSPPLSIVSGSTGEMFTRPKIDIPQQQINDFIWDWSSRPEIPPPSEYETKFKRPIKHHHITNRDSTEEGWNSIFDLVNLPKVIFSHACSFLVGATLMFICFKKYSSIARLLRIV